MIRVNMSGNNPKNEPVRLKLADKSERRRKLLFGVLVSCLLTCLVFAAIEFRYPYFFTTDDNADWYTSEYAYVIRTVLRGEFPLYSFTQFCGQRLFANGQCGVLNPFIYIAGLMSHLLFGDYRAIIEFLAILMMIAGAIGAYLLLERLGACQAAAIAGAVAWNFNAYNIWVGNSWILVIMTTGVLPFIYYGSLRFCEKPSFANCLWAILPKVFLFYIGHPQFFFYAALYDCLFIGSYVFLKNKGTRVASFFKIVGQYVLIYIAVVILILPQLVPLYKLIGMTSQKGALDFKEFAIESDSLLMGAVWPFTVTKYRIHAVDPFIGYPLILCVIGGLYTLPFLLTSKKEKLLKHKDLMLNMAAVVPGCIIAFLSNYSEAFQHVLYALPFINRFHYLHRNNLYLTSLSVIFAAMACTFLWRTWFVSGEDKKPVSASASRIAGTVFVLLEAVNMALLFSMMQQWSRGPMYKLEDGYDFEYTSMFKEDRYVCLGYKFNVMQDEYIKRDIAHCLRYNMASYYGISNVSGYYGVYTTDTLGRKLTFFKKVQRFTGDIWNPYDGFVEEMRGQSVRWYVVNPGAAEDFVPFLEDEGMTKVHEDAYGIVYRDPDSEPLAFDSKGNKISLEQGDVNYLKLNTGSDFTGGTITLNYSSDSNLHCFIDGNEVPITADDDYWQMTIECPAGAHEIYIRYIDREFTACLIVTGAFVILSVALFLIFKHSIKRNEPGKGKAMDEKNKTLNEIFDKCSENYRAIHTENIGKVSGADSDYFSEYKIREILDRYPETPAKWLDLGCGDGLTAVFVRKYFPKTEYHGLDISVNSIEKANKRGLEGPLFHLYDGEKIPFEDNTFDVVFMACVMHHISPGQREGILNEIRRVLKVDGKLIVFEHNTYNPVTRKLVNDCIFDNDAILVNQKEFGLLLKKTGYKNIKRRYTIFFPRKKAFGWLLPLEKHLSWCMFGGQYYYVAVK
ncbi:MAG: class I SAM-dependent methyltransferase [Ruminococcaceae bacterium]|nr:class I SAM-dependent methyltransferase [Oscillospiraceae bacterium]